VSPQVRQGTTLSNEIVNEDVLAFFDRSVENGRKSESMVSIGLRMRHPIHLDDTTFQNQIELLTQESPENPGYRIHSRCFNCVNREKPGAIPPQHAYKERLNLVREDVGNQPAGGSWVPDLRFRIKGMSGGNGFVGAN
jgi:hypothetical protein